MLVSSVGFQNLFTKPFNRKISGSAETMFKKPVKVASSNPLGGKDAKKVFNE
jgi:hypothetical protein